MPDPPPHDDEEKGKGKEDKDEEEKEGDRKEYRAGNCNDCNRQFCLDYNLPICKKAGMEDVFTTCFRQFFWCISVGRGGWRVLTQIDTQSGIREKMKP